MANIPGSTNVLPGVFTDVITQTRGVAIPGGARLAAIIGEGSTDEVIVTQALGGGQDGLNPSYTSTSGADGRHFLTTNFPLISNRTTLFKNGIPLVGLESVIDGNPFNFKYDYRIDITNGRIELQQAHLLDQGGSFYVPLATNVGDGYFSNLTLQDANAPPEIWTVRCIAVQRNPLNQPIAGTAKFIAIGSVSGAKLDANGNPIIWVANGQTVTNGILSFAIFETKVGAVTLSPFREGDAFTIKVSSGVLVTNDTLTANYIPASFLNDPLLLQGMLDVVNRHGFPSATNNLSLGAQLAFANNAPAVITVQAAPALPRRTSYLLSEAVDAISTDNDDFIFPLPLGVVPDFNSNIHFFITNNSTNVETQILPNKLEYYKLGTAGFPTVSQFIYDNTPAPGGYSYFYTVIESIATIATGFDGYIGRNLAFYNQGVFSSSITFDSTYVGKQLKIIDTVNRGNRGTYTITGVSGGKLSVTLDVPPVPDFVLENTGNVAFQVIDVDTDLPLASGTDGSVVPGVGTTAAFDSNTVTGVDFSTISNILTRRLKITGSTLGNNGLYDIVAFNSLTNTLTLQMTIVNENNMRYEVLDPTDTSNYVVINKNVVPNGYALRVSIIDSRDASFYDAGWVNALASLETVECDIVVPLPRQTISVIFQNALQHCKTMSNIRNKKERVLFAGAISGLTPANVTGSSLAAVEDIGILEGIQGDNVTEVLSGNIEDLANYSVPDAFGNTFRCVYFYPDQIVVQASGQNLLVDGFYIAAAAAGYESADTRIENPLTNKVVSGFTILRNKQFSTLTLESLAAAGVCVLQPVAGGGRVVWGITTSQSGFPEEQEISIVFIRDRVAKALRAGFVGYIGQPETPDTGAILNTRAVILLNALVSQGLITNYADLSVVRDSVDPRQWNITVRVQPTYPVNFIYIKVALGQI
jgi:hypothetical protein